MNVADLLKKKLSPNFILLAGANGLSREITSINIFDAPDIDKWLRGGEFVIGTGFIFKDNPEEFTKFVKKLHYSNAAALGIKLGRFHVELPKKTVETAEELNFPIIEIPVEYRWPDIFDIFYQTTNASKVNRKHELDIFNEICDVNILLSRLSMQISRKILVICPSLGIYSMLISENGEINVNIDKKLDIIFNNDDEIIRISNNISLRIAIVDSSKIAIYSTNNDEYIKLILYLKDIENTTSFMQNKQIIKTITILRALIISKKDNIVFIKREKQYIEYLCRNIFKSEENILLENAKKYNVCLNFPCRVIVIYKKSKLHFSLPYIKYFFQNDNIWVGIMSIVYSEKQLYLDKQLIINKYVILGPISRSYQEISESYNDAKQMLDLLCNIELQPGIYDCNKMHFIKFLFQVANSKDGKEVWYRYWYPLKLNSDKYNTIISIEKFVKILIKTNYNVKMASEYLHIHYNTSRKYIKKLEELLDIDYDNRYDRMALTMACYIDQINNEKNIF